MARQRSRWASGTVQTLRTGANPLTIPGLNPLQRLAYLEGIVHWFNVLPQLLLVLMPLSLGVLGVAPLRVSGEGLLWHALPFYGVQLLLTRWLCGHARTALLPELYRWIFLVPVAAAVASTLLGRPLRFRVTPKALASGRRIGAAKRLVLPLLFLLTVQLVAVGNLLTPALGRTLATLSGATLTINLVWAALNIVLLLLALRSCWDRPGLSEQPWFALRMPCVVEGAAAQQLAAEVETISEVGVELRLIQGAPLESAPSQSDGERSGAESPAQAEQAAVDLRQAGTELTLRLPSLTPLPIQISSRKGTRLGCTWSNLTHSQVEQLQGFLYSRPALWPVRRAPFEPLALLVVLGRLLIGCKPETWFRRSALPQES
jgi:cellulose synthase (UDP-forming)